MPRLIRLNSIRTTVCFPIAYVLKCFQHIENQEIEMGKVKISDDQTRKTNYGFYGIFGLVTYFIWCDLSFFGELAAEQANGYKELKNTTLITHITIKLKMQDHFGHYLFLPFTRWLNVTFQISKISWVTPNVITLMHFCIAFVCGRLLASCSIFLRRTGVALYEVRSMLDVLDGVVYRAQAASTEFLSGWGTYGYLTDALADTIGGLFVMCGSIYRLNKYLPFKNPEDLAKLKYKFRNYDEESCEALLSADDSCSEEAEELYSLKRYTRRVVNLSILFFTFTVILRSGLWDHFNHGYHNLLGVKRADISPVSLITIHV